VQTKVIHAAVLPVPDKVSTVSTVPFASSSALTVVPEQKERRKMQIPTTGNGGAQHRTAEAPD
jgi:hypothetical protein